jgi:drug/metabolite transporter (DMT)-like permease
MLAVSALHMLMRRGQAARVTSLVYLTPIFAVVLEWIMFDVIPSSLSIIGIATTCCGVALTVWRPVRASAAA